MDAKTLQILNNSLAIFREKIVPDFQQSLFSFISSRVIEVPWVASCLARWSPNRVCDIGLSLASLDYLGLLLEYARQPGNVLDAIDIINPERVRTRYPKDWWPEIRALNISICDVREVTPSKGAYQLVTCISVIEHIGFDKPCYNNQLSAFDRSVLQEEVSHDRDPGIDDQVMARFYEMLEPGGRCIISVPMGFGGAMLLRDSLGFYCAQWEYSLADWQKLTSVKGFKLEEEIFFAADENLIWYRKDSAESLSKLRSVPLSHSRGVGMAVMRKLR